MKETRRSRAARSRWLGLLPVAVLLVASVFLQSLRTRIDRAERDALEHRFRAEAGRVVTKVHERMDAYDEILRGVAGLLAASSAVTRSEFGAYMSHLELGSAYRGIQGVGLALVLPPAGVADHEARVRAEGFPAYAVHPESDAPLRTSIVYLEPFEGRNLRAFGYDMFSEPVRRAAMERARDSGLPATSRPVRLVQETNQDVQPGVLTYLALYRGGVRPSTMEKRREWLVGWAYSPLRTRDLLEGILHGEALPFRLRVLDGSAPDGGTVLHDSQPEAAGPVEFTFDAPLDVNGAPWVLRFTAGEAFVAAGRQRAPALDVALLGAMALLLAGVTAAAVAGWRARSQALDEMAGRGEAEAGFREIAERSQAGILIVRDGEVVYANPAAAEAAGRPPVGLLGPFPSIVEAVVHPEDRARVTALRPSPETPGRIESRLRCRVRRPEGELRSVEVTERATRFEGEPALLLTLYDVTDRERIDEELARTQRLESLALLAGGMAHDFNNLLTSVFGHAEAARHGLPPEASARHELDVVVSALDRARDLTRQLLTFATGGAPRHQVVPVAKMLEEAVRIGLGGSSLRARVEVEPGTPPVDVDEGQMNQVLSNLLVNARQAIAGAGQVVLRARPRAARSGEFPGVEPGPCVEITVRDDGPGIPPETLPRVFDPFFTTRPGGTGLGLATCHSIVRRHGGHVSIASRLGEGTTVTVILPAAKGPAAAEAPPAAGVAAGVGRLRVLLLDDERLVARAGEKLLARGGHEVEVVATGEAAVAAWRRAREEGRPFDVGLFDLTVVGGLGGGEAIRRIREFDPHARAIACSGYFDDDVMASPGAFGFAGALPKPYLVADLDAALALATRGREPPPN